MPKIRTIGYEQAEFDDFVATLVRSKINLLIDVRDFPGSRKRGFSKTALADGLRKNGIEYVHLKGLGDPKEGRDAARAGRMNDFRRIFSRHMKTDLAKEQLLTAADYCMSNSACLMCYEREPKDCHRSIVAKMICDTTKLMVEHIGVAQGLARRAKSKQPAKVVYA